MALLSREAILAASDLKTEEVAVPEWGGAVLVRGLTGAERDVYEQSVLTGKGKNRDVNLKNARAKLIAMSVIDESGNRLFNTGADVEALGKKSAAAIQRVFEVAQRLSGLSDSDVEELAGNSSGQSEDSTSA